MSNQTRRDSNSSVNSSNNISEEAAYREGYQTGRDSERIMAEDRYVARENNSAATGLTIGLALALLAGLAGGAFYYVTQRQEPSRQTAPSTQIVPVPVPNNSQPQTPSRNKETTIIERTIDKTRDVVPVPQQPSAAPSRQESSQESSNSAPNINITVPPAQQQQTENKSAPAQSESNSGSQENSNSDRSDR